MTNLRMPTSTRRPRLGGGFTLFELVIVMLVISTLVAIAMPAVRGFWSGSRSRDAATELLATMQYARAKSAAEARIYRMTFDADNAAYQLSVQDGVEFVATGTEFGQVIELPQGMRMEVMRL